MNAEEKAALAWLDHMIARYAAEGPAGQHTRTLKRVLAQPRLPEEPSEELTYAVAKACDWLPPDAPTEKSRRQFGVIYRALYAHLTKPKTKTVEVWHVEYAMSGVPQVRVCDDEKTARGYLLPHKDFQCIRVTGPHQHEVPT